MKFLNNIWKDIKRGENIDLYITVVFAIVLACLNLVGLASPNLLDSVLLAILGLLAFSSLGTRHYIEYSLKGLSKEMSLLKGRSELLPLKERAKFAREVVITGIDLIGVVTTNADFFSQKLKDGCNLKILLLHPSSPSIETWENMMSKVSGTKEKTIQSLTWLEHLLELQKSTSGKCEVRLSNVFLPFRIEAFDPEKENGSMNVEIFVYKKYQGDRPNLVLTRTRDPQWFANFYIQFQQLWDDSVVWSPSQQIK